MKSPVNGYFLLACESPVALVKLPATCRLTGRFDSQHVNFTGRLWLEFIVKKRGKLAIR